jgi:hypothetical protein
MASHSWNTVVLGAGPVGLIAALAAARRGRTTLVTPHWPPRPCKPRIDVIPAPFLTLLLELGVDPGQLDIEHLHDARLVAWETAEPTVRRCPASAHVERSRLECALAYAAGRAPNIEVVVKIGDWPSLRPNLVIDATGRAAISAEQRVAPRRLWHAQTFYTATHVSKAVQGFRMAALPSGYVYRLGSAHHLMVGVVRCGARRSPDEIEDDIRASGGSWLLAGVPHLISMCRGRGGATSVQWSEGGYSPTRVGDASLARDSLASQGIAAGGSDALQLASGTLPQAAPWLDRVADQRNRHLAALRATIAACRFDGHSTWTEYARFIASHTQNGQSEPREYIGTDAT